MYDYTSALESHSISTPGTLVMTTNIKCLEVNVDGFYSVLPSTEINNAMTVALVETKTPGMGYINPRGLQKLSVSFVKSSVIFTYADTRGLYLEYWSGEQHTKNCFTLHVQWKELGIEDPTESHFQHYLSHLKKGIMSRYFTFILSKGSKARKALLDVMDRISFALHESYKLCNNFSIQTNDWGSWDLYKDRKKIKSNILLEQITLSMLNPGLH